MLQGRGTTTIKLWLRLTRPQKHGGCSEPFFRQTLLDDINSTPGRTTAEKKAMMEILRRVEDGEDAADGGDAEAEALAAKLDDIDLGQWSQ